MLNKLIEKLKREGKISNQKVGIIQIEELKVDKMRVCVFNAWVHVRGKGVMWKYKFITKHFITIVIFVCVLSISIRARCDEVHLKSGNSIKGVITTESEESLTIEVGIGSFTILKSEIESIDRDVLEANEQLKSTWEDRKRELEEKDSQMKTEEAKVETRQPEEDQISPQYETKSAKEKKKKDAGPEKVWYNFTTPEKTFNSFMYACEAMDFKKSDLCYTKEFQDFTKTDQNYLSHRNSGQLRNAYSYWHGKPYKIELHGDKAIMRFSPPLKRPEPFYFVREGGEWKIDGVFSFRNVIIEDSQNWHWRNSEIDNEKLWLRK